MDPLRIAEALEQPAAWPSRPAHVGHLETHISRLYFVGDRVYKVKKPIVLPFVDYGTLERRAHFCAEEVRLNRRLAPEVYLRVAPIAADAAGAVALDGPGAVVEWAVEMVRLPEHGMLDGKLERGEVDQELVGDLARWLARFHAGAATGPGVDEHAAHAAVARNVRDNFVELAPHAGRGADVLSPRLLAHLSSWAERFLASQRELFEQRVAAGRARDGHGDLHAGNVCITPGGIVAYDCIEFSARLRCADVACELAFLAMDLDARGFRGFSWALVLAYARAASDGELGLLIDFYKAYRAVVRGKVAVLRALGAAEADQRREARRESQRYLHLAASYALPPMLVITCGLPASGKSWIAEHVARPFEAFLVRSDVRRKLLAGVPLDERRREGFAVGLYSQEMKELTYASLLDSARAALTRGQSAVIDAMFSKRAEREPFRALARELGVPFVAVHVVADEDVVRERLAARARDPSEPSDADWDVYLASRAAFEPPLELPASQRVELASGIAGEDAVALVIERVLDASDAG